MATPGTGAVSPALAACSKALIETLAKTDTLPAYTVKAPSVFVSDMVDPNAFTVIAKSSKTKAAARQGFVQGHPGRRDRFLPHTSHQELRGLNYRSHSTNAASRGH